MSEPELCEECLTAAGKVLDSALEDYLHARILAESLAQETYQEVIGPAKTVYLKALAAYDEAKKGA
jgi:hypothetical protein